MLVFSLGWSLPPTLGCIHKQPDSKVYPEKTLACLTSTHTGLSPSLGHVRVTVLIVGLRVGAVPLRNDLNTTLPSDQTATGFGVGLFPVHSPLLGESLLVSFPPLSDMLKFSGYSRLIRGQEMHIRVHSIG